MQQLRGSVLLAAPASSLAEASSPAALWALLAALAVGAVTFLVLWLRAKNALAATSAAFAAVSEQTAEGAPLADAGLAEGGLPTSGPFRHTGPALNRSLTRFRSAQSHAALHDVALATMESEKILEAGAAFAEVIARADGLGCASITCARFFEDNEPLTQSHTRLLDGDRELVVLSTPESIEWPEGSTAQRISAALNLPIYLDNLKHPLSTPDVAHIDVVPLRSPRSSAAGSQVLGVLALGRQRADAPPLRLDEAPGTLALTRSIAHALASSERKQEAERLANDSLVALARAADFTSTYTRGHSERVAKLAVRLGEQLGLMPSELERLRRAALLHDLGSVAISHRLLDQEESYDEEQRALMRPHIELGIEVLQPLSAFADVLDIIGQHHEWWNGDGYPGGLKGEEIDPLARILTVVDVYEAMTSTRPYRRALEPDRALAHLEQRAGAQFEPRVVEALAVLLDPQV